jgi:hypothetical protein
MNGVESHTELLEEGSMDLRNEIFQVFDRTRKVESGE